MSEKDVPRKKMLTEILQAVAPEPTRSIDEQKKASAELRRKVEELHEEDVRKIEQEAAYRSQTSLSLEDAEKYTWGTYKPTKDNEAAARQVKAWSPSEMDVGLFLYGSCGTGKTHALKALIQHHYSETHTFRYVQAAELVSEFKNWEHQKATLAKYAERYALVIDDLGALAGSDFDNQVLFRILEARRDKGRVTFLCCDVSGDQLRAKFDGRVIDRFKEFTVGVRFPGKSLRTDIHTENRKRLVALAGIENNV